MLGKNHSEEIKKKMSDAQKGHIVSEESRKKMSEANKGHIVSEKTRKKISNTLGMTHDVIKQRRVDIINTEKIRGWKIKLAQKWNMSPSGIHYFIHKYALDLI